MNILYYSLHAILEDDEVRIIKSLGHNVFVIGVNSPSGEVQGFRPAIEFSAAEIELYMQFEQQCSRMPNGDIKFSEEFIDLFDILIVMHDVYFVEKHFEVFRRRSIVVRLIGQSCGSSDQIFARLEKAGVIFLGYSSVETSNLPLSGKTPIIRFCKDPAVYGNWMGNDLRLLTFSNHYAIRYPEDFEDFKRISKDVEILVGGIGNENVQGSIGRVAYLDQLQMYQNSRVYYYGHGLHIPYTLNFIEAWMTGIPVIVHAPRERQTFFEIDKMITHDVDGLVCRDVATAHDQIKRLLSCENEARRIGQAGRARAIELFGIEPIREEWRRFLTNVAQKRRQPGRLRRLFQYLGCRSH